MPQVRGGLHPWPTTILPLTIEVENIKADALLRIKWQHDDAVVVKAI